MHNRRNGIDGRKISRLLMCEGYAEEAIDGTPIVDIEATLTEGCNR